MRLQPSILEERRFLESEKVALLEGSQERLVNLKKKLEETYDNGGQLIRDDGPWYYGRLCSFKFVRIGDSFHGMKFLSDCKRYVKGRDLGLLNRKNAFFFPPSLRDLVDITEGGRRYAIYQLETYLTPLFRRLKFRSYNTTLLLLDSGKCCEIDFAALAASCYAATTVNSFNNDSVSKEISNIGHATNVLYVFDLSDLKKRPAEAFFQETEFLEDHICAKFNWTRKEFTMTTARRFFHVYKHK